MVKKVTLQNLEDKYIIICDIPKDDVSIVAISLFEEKKRIFYSHCKQNNFCEQLPLIMKKILSILKKKSKEICLNDIKYLINFEIDKHVTTYRIFESFFNGFTINK